MSTVLQQVDTQWRIATSGRALYRLDSRLASWLHEVGAASGWVQVFLPHTSAGLILQENADPDVQRDLLDFFHRLVPDGDPRYRHQNEGPDDMAAHIRTTLTQNSLSIPVRDGGLQLGTWQGLYLFEHRQQAQQRHLWVGFTGRCAQR
ncbi:secondary thiamine-phosphate synthase enzyme YjbQ [Acidithiobacillus sp.]|uniref:secondary thiamine-phosphate synthase enzyme YjbQ n=1 Tax=Acidithiobacillus sp. TaxID=1872118 RepID=UPI0025C546B0|nr:secondary thiamine-phosphate synthase enzyme YjbQ [Acidithiobacillus sp.]